MIGDYGVHNMYERKRVMIDREEPEKYMKELAGWRRAEDLA
jgi:hypothetical protein